MKRAITDFIYRATGIAIPGSSFAEIEREAILRTIESVGGSTSHAAKILGVSPRKIQYRMKKYLADASQGVARPKPRNPERDG